MMFNRILVVCTGNICRSPVAEALLKRSLPQLEITSAGLGAVVGAGVEPQARVIGEAAGLALAEHKARQLTPDMVARADLILVMSEGQRQAVGRMAPAALGKTFRLGHWLPGGGGQHGQDVPDPYRKSDDFFALVHERLVKASELWVAHLCGDRRVTA